MDYARSSNTVTASCVSFSSECSSYKARPSTFKGQVMWLFHNMVWSLIIGYIQDRKDSCNSNRNSLGKAEKCPFCHMSATIATAKQTVMGAA